MFFQTYISNQYSYCVCKVKKKKIKMLFFFFAQEIKFSDQK